MGMDAWMFIYFPQCCSKNWDESGWVDGSMGRWVDDMGEIDEVGEANWVDGVRSMKRMRSMKQVTRVRSIRSMTWMLTTQNHKFRRRQTSKLSPLKHFGRKVWLAR